MEGGKDEDGGLCEGITTLISGHGVLIQKVAVERLVYTERVVYRGLGISVKDIAP